MADRRKRTMDEGDSERGTASLFAPTLPQPLAARMRPRTLDEIVGQRQLLTPGKQTIASEWCIADADFALMLMRLVANGDSVPAHLRDYAQAQWARPSIRKYLGYIPAAS